MTSQDASGNSNALGVGIVHANPLTLWALRELLGTQPDMDVLLARSSLRQVCTTGLNVLILDPNAGSVTSAAGTGVRMSPRLRVLMMTSTEPGAGPPAPAAPGMTGHLSDRANPRVIVAAVRAAGAHHRYTPHSCDVTAGGLLPERELAPLSVRERQVLTGIAKGLTHDQVAYRLRISRHTVDTYVKRVRRKLGLGNKAELARAAAGQDFFAASR
ncbi:response regulator transcription factor [Streptomyces zingiberis]|uniref:Response regulator transcription factor n=1 Tax=Streptomyces zingiberis TaxID=2053010 RepID=A0ABX1BRA6_9ACTN|nr:LuxR C-terminal-related transcriptional regulator [Streptomyces zingiberis]NJQ00269.1 response regulator transcription factor [Streptomyces zingiberis]